MALLPTVTAICLSRILAWVVCGCSTNAVSQNTEWILRAAIGRPISRFTRFIEFPDYTPLDLCRIFGLMCRKNGLTLAPALKEALIHHFHHLHEVREENFGNARLVRNCFESLINAQATRLSSQSVIDASALSLLEAPDLESDAFERATDYRARGLGYQVKCDDCGQVYVWKPELDLREAQCTACNKVYNGEFGYLESTNNDAAKANARS